MLYSLPSSSLLLSSIIPVLFNHHPRVTFLFSSIIHGSCSALDTTSCSALDTLSSYHCICSWWFGLFCVPSVNPFGKPQGSVISVTEVMHLLKLIEESLIISVTEVMHLLKLIEESLKITKCHALSQDNTTKCHLLHLK